MGDPFFDIRRGRAKFWGQSQMPESADVICRDFSTHTLFIYPVSYLEYI